MNFAAMGFATSQNDFAKALLDAGHPVPAGITTARGQADASRFNVYRNNVYVGLTKALAQRFPVERVGEIHLADYDETVDGVGDRLLIDAHGSPVKTDVMALYEYTLARTGPVPTLIEWDNDVPDFTTLHAEAMGADALIAGEATRRNHSRAA